MPANIPVLGIQPEALDALGRARGCSQRSATPGASRRGNAWKNVQGQSGSSNSATASGYPASRACRRRLQRAGRRRQRRPVKHTGLELARANIDTPIEKIAMERGGQKAVDQVSSMAVGMTPRQLQQSYGGMFMSRAEPLFASLGITRQDFEQAAKMPPTRQDIKMRFGGDFGGMGGEEPSAWSFQAVPRLAGKREFRGYAG